MDAVEASGKSIDDAILQALARLGRRRDEVEVQVLQEPARGVRGVGAKEARVRVWLKQRASTAPSSGAVLTPDLADQWIGQMEEEFFPPPAAPPRPPTPPVRPTPPRVAPTAPPPPVSRAVPAAPARPPAARPPAVTPPPPPVSRPPAPRAQPPITHSTPISRAVRAGTSHPTPPPPMDLDEEPDEIYDDDAPYQPVTGDTANVVPDEIIQQATEILQTMLNEMQFPATIVVTNHDPLTLNIRVGGNPDLLGLLIGKRGETLTSLQLLVNLILNHHAKQRCHVLVDVEHYRQRRDDSLKTLAARIARQVQQSRHAMALEPMTPYERRIVHMTLQDSPYVQTQSTGEGDQRRVVISLKLRQATQ